MLAINSPVAADVAIASGTHIGSSPGAAVNPRRITTTS
jgi:hypothetical protein